MYSLFALFVFIGLFSCSSNQDKEENEISSEKIVKPAASSFVDKQVVLSDSTYKLNKSRLEVAMKHALWERALELFNETYLLTKGGSLDSTICKNMFQSLYQKVYLLERLGNIEEAFALQLKLDECEVELDSEQKKLKSRVELLKDKWNTWPTVLSPHFSVRVDGIEAYNSLPKVLRELEETAQILGEVLNVSLVERIPLRLFKSSPQRTEAWYDGALVVALDWIESDSLETVKILRHELMHAYLTQIRGDKVSRWYHEGMARNFEDLKINVRDYDSKEELERYSDVDGDFRAKGASLKKAYILANERIHCWIDKKGIDEFINVLNNERLNLDDELPYECLGDDILGY